MLTGRVDCFFICNLQITLKCEDCKKSVRHSLDLKNNSVPSFLPSFPSSFIFFYLSIFFLLSLSYLTVFYFDILHFALLSPAPVVSQKRCNSNSRDLNLLFFLSLKSTRNLNIWILSLAILLSSTNHDTVFNFSSFFDALLYKLFNLC